MAAARVDTAFVELFGELVGAVAWDEARLLGTFEFAPEFLERGLDPAPLRMSIADARRGNARFVFHGLSRDTFMGLPGLLADALPDRFGNSIIDSWLARQGRSPGSFSPVERLCYTGRRGMGALEFAPAVQENVSRSVPVEIAELVALAQSVVDERGAAGGAMSAAASDALLDILRVGTSAGGGRPKAVVTLSDETGEIRSGQVDAPPGFAHWLLKFDGVQDSALGDPPGYGRVEYAYYRMAIAAGIEMPECRLLVEGDRAHFMARRFDRPAGGGKLHLQSLCALAHLDFQDPAAHSYEQAFQVIRELRLPYPDAEEMYRRALFNVIARNQDDHTKNVAFLMDREGEWRLSPGFDLTYAYNPGGRWTARHQMSIGGKREGFDQEDLMKLGETVGIKRPERVLARVREAVAGWERHALEAGVEPKRIVAIRATHRFTG